MLHNHKEILYFKAKLSNEKCSHVILRFTGKEWRCEEDMQCEESLLGLHGRVECIVNERFAKRRIVVELKVREDEVEHERDGKKWKNWLARDTSDEDARGMILECMQWTCSVYISRCSQIIWHAETLSTGNMTLKHCNRTPWLTEGDIHGEVGFPWWINLLYTVKKQEALILAWKFTLHFAHWKRVEGVYEWTERMYTPDPPHEIGMELMIIDGQIDRDR